LQELAIHEEIQTMNGDMMTGLGLILIQKVRHFLDGFIVSGVGTCEKNGKSVCPCDSCYLLPRIIKTPMVFTSTYSMAFLGSRQYLLSTEIGTSLHSTSK
jgi:hypothetical protein